MRIEFTFTEKQIYDILVKDPSVYVRREDIIARLNGEVVSEGALAKHFTLMRDKLERVGQTIATLRIGEVTCYGIRRLMDNDE